MQVSATQNVHAYDIAIATQIEQLQTQIKHSPAKAAYRIHLTQLFMINGQWQRALQQLQVAAKLDAKAVAMAQTYRSLIQAEIHREQTLKGLREPQYLLTPENWQLWLAEALIARKQQQAHLAEQLQQQAYAAAPACAFAIDQHTVNWIADGDSCLGPQCEIIINGDYYWLAFDQIQQLDIEAPQDLRDLVWIPAKLTLKDLSQHLAFLPSRYAFSYEQGLDQLSLSALTEWVSQGENSWTGLGQKMFITDQFEQPLLAIKTLLNKVSE